MRRVVVLCLAIILITGLVAAHADNTHAEDNNHDNEEEEIFRDAVISMVLDNVNLFSIGSFILLLSLVAFLGWDLYKKSIWHIPHSVSFLLIILTISLVFVLLFVSRAEVQPEPVRSFGPGVGPTHMAHYYTDLNVRNAKRLGDFREAFVAEDIVRDPTDLPPPIDRNESKTINITLTAQERIAELADGIFYYYWTFDGKVPGPIIRVREGDTVILTLRNEEESTHNHSIDLHAVTGPGGGGVLTQVAPGGEKTMKFKALEEGFYVYHCASPNIPTHIANQMFGGIIVEPKEGMSPADKEFVLFQGEIYTKGVMGEKGFQAFDPHKMLEEKPTYYTFNGKPAGATGEHRMEAGVNDTVRLFFGNMGNAKISSFHVIGEIFDKVYYGDFEEPVEENMETVPVAAGQAAVTEFDLEVPGRYIPVDHALARLDRGAWSILEVEGRESPGIYQEIG